MLLLLFGYPDLGPSTLRIYLQDATRNAMPNYACYSMRCAVNPQTTHRTYQTGFHHGDKEGKRRWRPHEKCFYHGVAWDKCQLMTTRNAVTS